MATCDFNRFFWLQSINLHWWQNRPLVQQGEHSVNNAHSASTVESEIEPEVGPEAEVEPEVEPEVESETEPEDKSEVESEVEPDIEPEIASLPSFGNKT